MRVLVGWGHWVRVPTEFSRRLPHLYPQDRWLFVTCHLYGSLPPSRYPAPDAASSAGKAFVWMDRYLDTARSGPRFLGQDAIASLVVEHLQECQRAGHCDVGAYAVMPNHIHVLLLPKIEASRVLQLLKGTTARKANLALHRTGQSFWQRESYDRWVRDGGEWGRVAKYIENNPVKAGLVARAEEYRWSSAWGGVVAP